MHQRATLAVPRFEDFGYSSYEKTEEDSLAWMGNGMILAQEEGRSTTEYLNDVDIPPLPTIVKAIPVVFEDTLPPPMVEKAVL